MFKGEINKIAVEGSIVVCNVHKFEFFLKFVWGHPEVTSGNLFYF